VSPDSVESHRAFRAKHALPFRLLSDVDHAAAEAFGVWIAKGPSSLAGLQAMGNERTTFVVGADGAIESVLAAVQPELHTAQLLAAVGMPSEPEDRLG
jgi:peroxiredoxin Q/BCP